MVYSKKISDSYKTTEYTGNLVLTLFGIRHFPFLYALYTWENKRFVFVFPYDKF